MAARIYTNRRGGGYHAYVEGEHLHSWLTYILVVAALAALAGLLLWLVGRAMRSARRGMPGASGLGWALLFLSSGRMPPPPPASQITQELNTRKDRLASQQDEDP